MSGDEPDQASSKFDAIHAPPVLRDNEKQQDTEQSYLVDWDGGNDPLDPRTFSSAKKWFYVAVVAMGSLLVCVLKCVPDIRIC